MSIAVMSATQVDGPFKELKERLCRRKPKGVAMVACARKLLTVVWRVWTKRQPYADQNEQRYARKLAELDRRYGTQNDSNAFPNKIAGLTPESDKRIARAGNRKQDV